MSLLVVKKKKKKLYGCRNNVYGSLFGEGFIFFSNFSGNSTITLPSNQSLKCPKELLILLQDSPLVPV